MSVPTSEVGYTPAIPRREDHEIHKRTCGDIGKKNIDTQINGLMDNQYQKLNKKVDTLTKQTQTKHNNDKNAFTFYSRLINLSNIKFNKEQINTLTLGPNYAIS
jgi:hypothetical protein